MKSEKLRQPFARLHADGHWEPLGPRPPRSLPAGWTADVYLTGHDPDDAHSGADSLIGQITPDNRHPDAWAEGNAGWIKLKDKRPDHGALIVKRWRTKDSYWAGVFTGKDKEASFDEWVPLPAPWGSAGNAGVPPVSTTSAKGGNSDA